MALSRDAYIEQPSPIEPNLLALFDRTAALVIFDIGSCEGEDSIRYARLFPASRVFAVEPLPANVERIKTNIERYECSNVEVVPYAFSDRAGHSTFHVSSGTPPDAPPDADWEYGNKSSSLLAPDRHLEVHPWVRFDEEMEVDTETLDGFCAKHGIERIDLMHLDVQGAELMVLGGAFRMLPRTTAIWLEVERIPLYRDQPLVSDVERFMAGQGFRRTKQRVDRVSGDQLYVRADLATRGSGIGAWPAGIGTWLRRAASRFRGGAS